MSKWGRNLRRKWENILLYGSRTFLKALNHYGVLSLIRERHCMGMATLLRQRDGSRSMRYLPNYGDTNIVLSLSLGSQACQGLDINSLIFYLLK
jgi:hypothetical protein